MELLTEQLTNIALLGTEKADAPIDLYGTALGGAIATLDTDREDKFLRHCAAAFVYEAAGSVAPEVDLPSIAFTGEVGRVASGEVAQILKQALGHADEVVLEYLAWRTAGSDMVAPPSLVPTLLTYATNRQKVDKRYIGLAGAVGAWLAKFHDDWQPLFAAESDEPFEVATSAVRQKSLLALRAEQPAAARALLETVYEQENAEQRGALLETLQVGLCKEDMPFLEAQLKDKSKRVRETARRLLAQIPESSVARLYVDYWKRAVRWEQQRQLLRTKRQLVIDPSAVPDAQLFAWGMDKTSSQKGIDDSLYYLAQTIAETPPIQLAETLDIDRLALADFLLKQGPNHYLAPAMSQSVLLFRDATWVGLLIKHGHVAPELLMVLPFAERMPYYEQLLQHQYFHALPSLWKDPEYTVLPHNVAKNLLDALQEAPYIIDAQNYQRLALVLPSSVFPLMQNYRKRRTPENNMAAKYFDERLADMERLLDIRLKLQTFHP